MDHLNFASEKLTVLEEGSLNFGSGQTVARHVHDVVNAATDPVVALVIATSAITGELGKVLALIRT